MYKVIKLRLICLLPLMLCSSLTWAASSFEVTVLGDKGGIQDGNLTAFLVRANQDSNYVSLDAGTLVNGLEVAAQQGAFSNVSVPKDNENSLPGYILKEKIKGYLISHAHLDHVSGMVIASPEDSKKNIYGLESVNKAISDTYFNWVAWPNFANEGNGFKIGKYNYVNLPIGQTLPIDNTSLNVIAFPVNHPVDSAAFVIENSDNVMVFFGDTGPDEVEESSHLNDIWHYLAPKVAKKQLKGLIIEVSFPNETQDKFLFGHLTPKWLFNELTKFEQISGGEGSLQGMKVIIQHIKYSMKKEQNIRKVIKEQLDELNSLGVEIIIANQGHQITL